MHPCLHHCIIIQMAKLDIWLTVSGKRLFWFNDLSVSCRKYIKKAEILMSFHQKLFVLSVAPLAPRGKNDRTTVCSIILLPLHQPIIQKNKMTEVVDTQKMRLSCSDESFCGDYTTALNSHLCKNTQKTCQAAQRLSERIELLPSLDDPDRSITT